MIKLLDVLMNKISNEDDTKLVSYAYNFGGDMQGGHHSIIVKSLDENRAVVSISDAEWHNESPTDKEYHVSPAVLDSIRDIYDSCKMKHYPKRPKNPVFALDAGTRSYRFEFSNGNLIYFDDRILIPAKGYEGLRRIGDLIEEAVKEGELLQ